MVEAMPPGVGGRRPRRRGGRQLRADRAGRDGGARARAGPRPLESPSGMPIDASQLYSRNVVNGRVSPDRRRGRARARLRRRDKRTRWSAHSGEVRTRRRPRGARGKDEKARFRVTAEHALPARGARARRVLGFELISRVPSPPAHAAHVRDERDPRRRPRRRDGGRLRRARTRSRRSSASWRCSWRRSTSSAGFIVTSRMLEMFRGGSRGKRRLGRRPWVRS